MGKSQTQDVLDYMKENGGITSKEAFQRFGATRLSGLIWGLRKQGYEIDSVPKKVKTRYGKETQICVYTLKGKNEVFDRS